MTKPFAVSSAGQKGGIVIYWNKKNKHGDFTVFAVPY
jgi:hypothetical protein